MHYQETIGDCSRKYDNLLRQLDSVQTEIGLLHNAPHIGDDYQARSDELERIADHLTQQAEQVYALLAHSIAVAVHKRYRALMIDFVLGKKMRADLSDIYGYNYYYLCHILSAYCRQPLLPLSEVPHGESLS